MRKFHSTLPASQEEKDIVKCGIYDKFALKHTNGLNSNIYLDKVEHTHNWGVLKVVKKY